MAEMMEMSLDDIIKTKNFKKTPKPKRINEKFTANFKKRPAVHTAREGRVVDARLKIIERKRANIKDVREKINLRKPDARMKIMINQVAKFDDFPPYEDEIDYVPRMRKLHPMKPKYIGAPRGYVDYDNMEEEAPLPPPPAEELYREPITRKLYNPLASAPIPKRTFERVEEAFDVYSLPPRTVHPPMEPHRSHEPSYEARSRLSRSTTQSAGIFANESPKKPTPSSKGCRVIVTNLHSEVTVWDIKELFADIGGLVSAEIIRPGVAEVVYKTLKDAEDAVEVYHNRQLDGLPMKCLLINPTAPVTKPPGYSGSSQSNKPPLELDLDTLHSVLFKRH